MTRHTPAADAVTITSATTLMAACGPAELIDAIGAISPCSQVLALHDGNVYPYALGLLTAYTRDILAQLADAQKDRDTATAELNEVTAERDALASLCQHCQDDDGCPSVAPHSRVLCVLPAGHDGHHVGDARRPATVWGPGVTEPEDNGACDAIGATMTTTAGSIARVIAASEGNQ
jgi:hypothetical protein